MLYKSARPIPDKRSYEFIKKNINGKNIYKKHLPKDLNRNNLFMERHNHLIFFTWTTTQKDLDVSRVILCIIKSCGNEDTIGLS